LIDAIAGQIQIHSTAKSVLLPQIKSGKLRALAVEGDERWPELPDVPTLSQADSTASRRRSGTASWLRRKRRRR
jgi:tripartite-type tricarboxylate transporter receptor subunit TctC